MERPTCKTCPYWDTQWDAEIDAGHLDQEFAPDSDMPARDCRRWPPTHSALDRFRGIGREKQADDLMRRGYADQGEWLQTTGDDWCGEHPDFPAYLASLKSHVTVKASMAPAV
jgi:hypothetical protein